MRTSDEAEFRDFVSVRMLGWRRTAYLVCRDWYQADDVVAGVLDRLYRRWPRRKEIDNLEAYVGGMLARGVIDEKRRPWRRESLEWGDRDVEEVGAHLADSVDQRQTLDGYLARLAPRRRAVLVLRFYCDLSVEDTAEALGIAVGTVKSQAARGLEVLRSLVLESQISGE